MSTPSLPDQGTVEAVDDQPSRFKYSKDEISKQDEIHRQFDLRRRDDRLRADGRREQIDWEMRQRGKEYDLRADYYAKKLDEDSQFRENCNKEEKGDGIQKEEDSQQRDDRIRGEGKQDQMMWELQKRKYEGKFRWEFIDNMNDEEFEFRKHWDELQHRAWESDSRETLGTDCWSCWRHRDNQDERGPTCSPEPRDTDIKSNPTCTPHTPSTENETPSTSSSPSSSSSSNGLLSSADKSSPFTIMKERKRSLMTKLEVDRAVKEREDKIEALRVEIRILRGGRQ